ncbi:unnamed protein product [Macrosiphum euphorbiae]|uniref:Transposase domain-containing protein n=1 Tax=Macrosiphum euphorbiae TaxID=13131 RepID=A0AAV0WS82_9HEMI|nr:unnamed protein product [Macrosiphum euphorbiae]
MIRSYRSKRRKIQEELEFLNNNRPTILNSVKPLNEPVLDTNNVLKSSSVPSSNLTKSNVLDSGENYIFDTKQKNNIFIENPIVNQCVESTYDITNNVGTSPTTYNFKNDSERLKLNLANWAIERNVAQNTVNDLLSILKQHKCFEEIPSDCRTLLSSSSSKTKDIRVVNPGNYYHFGLKRGIENTLKRVRIEGNIKVVVGIDGLPLSKSSSSQFWPILAYLDPYKGYIFLIGLYHGHKKPADSNDFLRNFIEEAEDLVRNGIYLDNKIRTVSIHSICADAPAKSFIMKIKGHTGYFSCTRCLAEGEHVGSTCFPFKKSNCRERTHEGYINKSQEEHHVGDSLSDLIRIPGFDMVKSFPLDYMHLVALGVMRKLIHFWLHKGPLTVRLPSWKIKKISTNLMFLKSAITNDFVRKPRLIQDVSHWKATELRQFLIYTGPLALKNVLNDKVYNHFMVLNIAMTILLSPNIDEKLLNYSDKLLKHFVKKFEEIYGSKYISHNVHGLLHISQDYKRYGSLDFCCCFPFENHMKILKKMVRKHHKPLEQVVRRYDEQIKNLIVESKSELHNRNIILNYEHSNGPLLETACGPQYLKITLNTKMIINIRSSSDIHVLTKAMEVVKIINIAHCILTKEPIIIGYYYKNKESFYDKPINSEKLDIYIVNNLSNNLKCWKITDIHRKIILFSFENQQVTFPILHSEC